MSGLFPHHPASPATVTASADDLSTSGTGVRVVVEDVRAATQPALATVLGDLVPALRGVPLPVERLGDDLHEAAGFGASVLHRWSGEVVLFNAEVDRLNSEWEEAAGGSFGVSRPTGSVDQTPEEAREASHDFDVAVAAARAELRRRLTRRHTAAVGRLDDTGTELAGMLGRGPNQADWKVLAAGGTVPVEYGGDQPGVPGGAAFVLGPPTRPVFTWDEDFEYDSADPGFGDYLARAKWWAMLRGGQALRSDLDDATQMYRHYWDNNGEDIEFDYEEAYLEDAGVRLAVDAEIARAQQGAEALIRGGNSSFSMTGDPHGTTNEEYPETENWQKAIGGHQVWSSGDVRVDGNQVTMTVTVHGEDHYNFNRGQGDIATGAPDDENGRFTELGWARPFDSHGTVTRTVTWTLGDAGSGAVDDGPGEPERNPGREDREDERGSGDPDRPVVPDNNRDTGHARGL